MTASTPRLCGADVTRCADCRNAVAPSRVRRGEGCPRHPEAGTVPGSCERPAVNGHTRCRLHGAAAPQTVAAASERQAEAEARLLVAEAGWQPVTDPLGALAELLGEVLAVKDQLASSVSELTSLTITDQLGREDARGLLAAYERALDRAGSLLVSAGRLDLEGRIVRVREAQAALVLAALARTLSHPDLGLPPALQARGRALLAAELTGRPVQEVEAS